MVGGDDLTHQQFVWICFVEYLIPVHSKTYCTSFLCNHNMAPQSEYCRANLIVDFLKSCIANHLIIVVRNISSSHGVQQIETSEFLEEFEPMITQTPVHPSLVISK